MYQPPEVDRDTLLVVSDFLEESDWPHVADYLRVPRMFFTGSRVYGIPREYSDLDMVLSMTIEEERELLKHTDYKLSGSRYTIRYGNLNIIPTTDEKFHRAWYIGTQELIKRKPVTRNEAILYLETLFAEMCPTQARIDVLIRLREEAEREEQIDQEFDEDDFLGALERLME